MGWFNKPKLTPDESEKQHDNRVEIVVSKEANKETIRKAHETNRRLTDLLNENHFTIKIYVAAGGREQSNRGTKQ